MTLAPGKLLGPYEILSPIGAGGMGEVYKARDTRLDRIVAIKVLPPRLAHNAEARERFEREARTIGQLNHPHICTLHDIGEQDGIHYLVLEYLDGENLHQRLQRGPLSLEQVLEYGIQVSDALDAAHRHGATHRDIKPGNIMLVKTGTKVLDFGLAKLKQEVNPMVPLSQMPTRIGPPTEDGRILGTMHYMSPEQVEGKTTEIDGRADIFSFGAVVYEMLTGKRAFEGQTSASIMAKILEHDPPPMSTLQPLTPPALDRVVKTCLAKDREDRVQTARDLCRELKWIKEASSQTALPAPIVARHKWRERLGWIAAAVFLVAFLGALIPAFLNIRGTPKAASVIRFEISPPEGYKLNQATAVRSVGPAISPDGLWLAFEASQGFSVTPSLWIRSLDSPNAQRLPGTEGAVFPFWSPDSRSLGFFARQKLMRIELSGGSPQVICDVPVPRGGTWNRDDVIVFASGTDGLYQVAARDGQPTLLSKPDSSQQETFYAWPQFLPDGRHFLYLVTGMEPRNTGIYAGSLGSEKPSRIMASTYRALYASGYLLFLQGATLMAQPFDPDRLELTGEPMRVADQIESQPTTREATFSVSEGGGLVYWGGLTLGNTQLAWFDRSGRELGPLGLPGQYRNPRISPDGKRVAVEIVTIGTNSNIWLVETDRGLSTRFTFGSGREFYPTWSPDGSRIVYTVEGEAGYDFYQKSVSGTTKEERIGDPSSSLTYSSYDWSPDGRFIVFTRNSPADVFLFPVSGDHKPLPLLERPEIGDSHTQFSPDGRWIAYTSDESGTLEVYIQSFPEATSKLRVSTSGGSHPRWRRDGKELFYLSSDKKLMSVPVRIGATLEVGNPVTLFQTNIVQTPISPLYRHQYDVMPDGQRFLINVAGSETRTPPLTVVLNWTAGIKKQ